MKKSANIKLLKELVNSSAVERVELRTRGAQAYGIAEGEEYTIIVAYAKQGGCYYFIDREGRRFLASHYDRAEFLAGELLEVVANDRAAAMHAADQLERSGAVLVCAALLPLFFEECDRRGIQAMSTAAGVDNLGRMLTRYELVRQHNNESNSDTQSNESNEDNQTTAESSRLAQTVASIKACVVKGAQHVAFLFSLVAVAVFSFAVAIGCMSLVLALFDALDITGAARFALTLAVLFGPALELAINTECNALAVVARILPSYFPSRMPFGCFSFWGRMLRA